MWLNVSSEANNVRPSLSSCVFPFGLNVFSFSKWRTNIICAIFLIYHYGTFCLRRRSPGTTPIFWNVTALWIKSCSIYRWTVQPSAWDAFFVTTLNPFVCVHTQHTEAIKLQLNQNHPPMTQGKPTTPATADQYINDVFIKHVKNNKQQTHRRPGQICQVCTHGETHKFISNF